jgi:uncharacterized protein (DUF58 family)
MIWPTPRLARLVLGVAGVLVVAGFWGMVTATLMVCLGLVVPIAWDWLTLRRRPLPEVDLGGSHQASLRRPLTLPVNLRNASGWLEIVVDWPLALGGPLWPVSWRAAPAVGSASWRTVPKRRGVFEIGPVWLRLESPLRLWARRAIRPTATTVAVWPDIRGPADDSLGVELAGEGAAASWGRLQSGSDLRGLRPFVGGDDPRHVDWKATARFGAPVVREWQPDRRRSVLVAIDAGRLMRAEHDGESKFDAALRCLARVALSAEARGDSVGVVVFADDVRRYVPPLSGSGQAERLLRYVGDIEPTAADSNFDRVLPVLLRLSRRSLLVLLSDVIDGAGGEALVSAVTILGRTHVPIVALVRDPHLDDALQGPVAVADAAYRRAAAELVARERGTTIDLLRARGIVAFDLSMRALALTVVQAYLDAKRGGGW